MARLRVAVLISGGGSNLKALIAAASQADAAFDVVHVISNRADAGGLSHAKAGGIPAVVIPHKDFSAREAFDGAIEASLVDAAPDIVALAGFMRIMTTPFIERWRGRMTNIHPSLLPAFKGLKPQQQALDAGVSESGCTVHWVTPGVDEGPIIAQAKVPIFAGDTAETLAARILVEEHKLYPRALALIARREAKLPR